MDNKLSITATVKIGTENVSQYASKIKELDNLLVQAKKLLEEIHSLVSVEAVST